LAFRPIPNKLVEEDVFDHELKELMVHIFDTRKGHNMLVLMFDPRFKSMKLVTMFMGHEMLLLWLLNMMKNC
jgi:hypothetical protein